MGANSTPFCPDLMVSNKNNSEPAGPSWSSRKTIFLPSGLGRRAAHRLGKLGEELVGELLGGAVDQALAELRQLSADLRLDIVDEQRPALLLLQVDGRAALGEARHAAIALAGDPVAVRRIEVGEADLAFEPCLDRPDLVGGDGLELVLPEKVQRLAARNADLE